MDEERKVADLFRAAVADAPPASFDERDVAARSRRIAARHRTRLIAASSVAVVVLGGGLLVGTGALGHLGGTGATSSGSAAQDLDTSGRTLGNNMAPAPAGSAGRNQAVVPSDGTAPGFPSIPPKQGGGGDGKVGPDAGSAPGGCGPTDGELGVALANELPAVGARLDAAATVPPVTLTCPAGSRSIALSVRDGSAAGVLIAVLAPAGSPTNGFLPPRATLQVTTVAASGRSLTVLSVPGSGGAPAPLVGHLDAVAVALAPGF